VNNKHVDSHNVLRGVAEAETETEVETEAEAEIQVSARHEQHMLTRGMS